MPDRPCLILFAHGSRSRRWRRLFEELERTLRIQLGKESVHLAFLQFTPPTLAEAVEESVRAGFSHIRILPIFLATGDHLEHDLPAQIEELKRRFPSLRVEVLPPVGDHPRVLDLLRELALEAAA